mgnify:CR=1 FL=1
MRLKSAKRVIPYGDILELTSRDVNVILTVMLKNVKVD